MEFDLRCGHCTITYSANRDFLMAVLSTFLRVNNPQMEKHLYPVTSAEICPNSLKINNPVDQIAGM